MRNAMRKLLTSICAAAVLSVPAAALPAANATAATSGTAERTASTPLYDRFFTCTISAAGRGWAQCTPSDFYFPPGTSLYIKLEPDSWQPVDIAVQFWYHNDAGWHLFRTIFRYGIYAASGQVGIARNTGPVPFTARVYGEASSSKAPSFVTLKGDVIVQ